MRPRRPAALLLALLALPAAARADDPVDDCTSAEPSPILDAKKAKDYTVTWSKTMREPKVPDAVTETATLSPDVRVKITRAGCAHFVRTIEITIRKASVEAGVADQPFWFAKAAEILQALPLAAAEATILDGQVRMLRSSWEEPLRYDEDGALHWGVAVEDFETHSVELQDAAEGGWLVLTVGYDVAL